MAKKARPEQAHSIIVEKFGGLTKAHQATGIKLHRIQHMLRTGIIPDGDRQTFLDAAGRLGIEHVPADYIAHLRAPETAPHQTLG